jgi:hypothetical protein
MRKHFITKTDELIPAIKSLRIKSIRGMELMRKHFILTD